MRAVGFKGCRVQGLLGLKSLKDSRLGGVRARRLKGRRPLEAKAFGLKGLKLKNRSLEGHLAYNACLLKGLTSEGLRASRAGGLKDLGRGLLAERALGLEGLRI